MKYGAKVKLYYPAFKYNILYRFNKPVSNGHCKDDAI